MKKILPVVFTVLVLSVLLFFKNSDSNQDFKIAELRKMHQEHIDNSPFKDVKLLNKQERKAKGLPPNKYLEREWELTMNPELGRPTGENIAIIKKELIDKRLEELQNGRVPGDASDNNWIERGPNNVGGRTRAIMFDPNDPTNETVFAGGVSGGLWKNTNISNSSSVWTRVNIPDNLNVSSIDVDPNNSNIFYLGTGESYVGGDVNGSGVWKSIDGGNSWSNVLGGISGNSSFQSAADITINSPAGIAGSYVCYPTTAFGPAITSSITSNIVLVDDSSASPTEGCNTLTNGGAINGNIALVRRGSCNFTVKVKNAQNQGAVGVIVMNNVPGTPVAMGGTDATITIPSVMISKSDGDTLEAALGGGTVNGTLNPSTGSFTGVLVPGIQHVNDIKIRNNGGVSEVYVAAGDSFYSAANATTFLGGPEFGLYKSIDGGTSWVEINLPLTSAGNKHCPNDIEIGADNKIWLSTTNSVVFGDGGGEIFSSSDGVNFTNEYTVPTADRTQIAVSSTNAQKIYVLAEGTTTFAPIVMEMTTNGFASSSSISKPNDSDTGIAANDFTRGQAFYDLMLEVDPSNDAIVYAGGIDLFKSLNSGNTWNQFSHWYGGFGEQEVHADQHALSFAPGNSSRLIFGNDGGVYFSNNGGTSTNARNNGFNTSQFYSVGVAPTTAASGDNFAGGLQDNGTQQFFNATASIDSSYESQGGDGAATDYDQDGSDAYYISNYVYNNSIYKRNINATGSASKLINSESSNRGDFINQQDLDSNLNFLYTNYTDNSTNTPQVARYNTGPGGSNRTVLTDALLTGSPTAFKVSPYTTSSSKVYVGTVFGDLLIINNANFAPSWTEITGPNFVGSISDIEFGATENDIFVTMHNYGVNNIWYTNDGGANWFEKEGDLPDLPVKAILQNPLNTEEVIVGTELGVWYTQDFSSVNPSWYSAFNGMSNVKVTDLDMRDDYVVFASTYGRGIFSGEFTAPTFSVNDQVLENGIKVYPTVSNGEITIASNKMFENLKVNVFNINGQLVHSSDIVLNNSSKKINLNVSSGMYLVNITQGQLKMTKKIVIK